MPSVKGPLLVVWGSKDVFTPIDGPVGKYFRTLPSSRPDTEFHELPGGCRPSQRWRRRPMPATCFAEQNAFRVARVPAHGFREG